MISWIFSLIISTSLVATPLFSAAHAEDSTGSSSTEQTEAARREAAKKRTTELRDLAKTEREARKKALEDAKGARSENKLETAQTLATKLVEERVKLLSKLRDGEYTKKCSATAKTEAQAAISAAITRLQATSVTTTKSVDEVRSIIKDGVIGKNHVYVAILPAVRGMCASDGVIKLIGGKLSTLVTRLKSKGFDTTKLEGLLADAKISAQAAYDAYKKIANNPGSSTYKTDLAAAKTKLTDAKTKLAAAREEVGVLKAAASTDDTPKTESTN